MKQKIVIKSSSANTGGSFDVVSVWQVKNELLVLLENDSAGGGGDASGDVEREIEVITESDEVLPVTFYIINSRENRVFNTHQYVGTEAHQVNPFHFLLSIYEFNKLVLGGVCLAKRRVDMLDLRTLIREETEADVQLKTDELSKHANVMIARLLMQNPISHDVLEVMIKSGILNGHPIDNINLIGNLIQGMQKLSEADQHKMLRLYRTLGGGEHGPSLLTGYMHDVITDDVFGLVKYNRCEIDGYLALVEDLQPLTQKMVNTIFMEAHMYLMLHREVQKFDPTYECERYLYEKVDDVKQCGNLPNMISNDRYFQENDEPLYPWMTPDLFKKIVDHIDQVYDVTFGFKTLHQFGMLESHGDRLLANINATTTMGALKRLERLTANCIEPSLTNLDFPKVLTFFDSLNYIGQSAYRADTKDVGEMMLSILIDPELTHAVCELQEIFEINSAELFKQNNGSLSNKIYGDFKAQYQQALKELIASAKAEDDMKASIKNNLFAPLPQLSLQQTLTLIREKLVTPSLQPVSVACLHK